ncbi:MAG: hypothetical protein ACM3UW_08600, partial [Bacillota bacterium]
MREYDETTTALVESVLDTGELDQVFAFLRLKSDKQFIITDHKGMIYASSHGCCNDSPDDRYIDLPPEDICNSVYYDVPASTLYYRV